MTKTFFASHTKGVRTLAIMAVVAAMSQPASALVITGTPDGSWAAAWGANTALATATWNAAAAEYMAAFTDPIHINITMHAVTGTSVLGESGSPILTGGYGAIRNLFNADRTTADDNTFLGPNGSFSAVDPVAGNHIWWVTRAQAKAIKGIADDLLSDGTTTFGTGFTYAFAGGPRQVAGAFDFQGVCEHEISEIMGRIGISGGTIPGTGAPGYTVCDLLSYTGAGVRDLGNGPGSMSIDNGTTLIKAYNDQSSFGGDSRDWLSAAFPGGPGTTNDSYNAYTGSGTANPLSEADLREMDVLGYDRKAVPEPAPVLGVGFGLLLGGLLRRRK